MNGIPHDIIGPSKVDSTCRNNPHLAYIHIISLYGRCLMLFDFFLCRLFPYPSSKFMSEMGLLSGKIQISSSVVSHVNHSLCKVPSLAVALFLYPCLHLCPINFSEFSFLQYATNYGNTLYFRFWYHGCDVILMRANQRKLDYLFNIFFRLTIHKTSKLRNIGYLWGESTGDWCIPLTNGQKHGSILIP